MATNIATIGGEGSKAEATLVGSRGFVSSRGVMSSRSVMSSRGFLGSRTPSVSRSRSWLLRRFLVLGGLFLALPVSVACEEGGVGDPCIPEDEFDPTFPGFSKDEINIESRSFQCRTRVCLVANFQGRVSCKYGQAAGTPEGEGCMTPDLVKGVEPAVNPQLKERRPDQAVYCSYRCKAPQGNAPVQECPDGFECREMLADVGLGDAQLAGSYCIRNGTYVDDPGNIPDLPCTGTECGDPNDFY
jgi:hypothetical protein